MGKSYVLKGLSGKLGGYVMQGSGVLRVRFTPGIDHPVRVTALYEGGRTAAFEGTFGGEEMERPDGGGALAGAYVTAGGALLLHTGEAARAAFAHSREAADDRPAARAAPQQQRTQGEPRRETEPRSAQDSRAEEETLPQRRWPPPPCMPAARYVGGRWEG